MTSVYKNAFTEVYTILNYLNDEDYAKIPKNIITVIEKNQNLKYQFYIDESILFSEQKLLDETKAILYILYRNYIIEPKSRKVLLDFQNKKILELENKKREKFNSNDLFKTQKIDDIKKEDTKKEIVTTNLLVVKENIIHKIFKKISDFLNRKI